MMNQAQTI